MDNCAPTDRNVRPYHKVGGSGFDAQSLRLRRDFLELSNVAPTVPGDLAAPASDGAIRCRQVLVEILRPFGTATASADELVDEFGSLAGVLAAGPAAQTRILGRDNPAIEHLGMIRRVMLHALRKEALERPVLTNAKALMDYLFADMAHLPAERLRVLFLNSKNRLLRDEVMSEGSVNETPIYPREIIRRTLEIGATALILAHNHPSGDPEPSKADIEATSRITEAGRPFEIQIHDHVIVARSGWTSFRALGLI